MACWYEMTSIRISPFCELVRWVLEREGIAYKEACHAPILHIPFTKLAGGGVRVPVVRTPDAVLETQAVLEYIDARTRNGDQLYPVDPDQRSEVNKLVPFFLDELAIAVRLYAYANVLPNARVAGGLMTVRAPWWERILVRTFYPIQAWALRKRLGITPASTEDARKKILSSFEDLSARLRSRQRYLTGDQLTAADLTFAAVTAPVTLPPEYGAPLPRFSDLPEPMQATVRTVRSSSAGQLALRLYQDHRRPLYRAEDSAPSAGERWNDRVRRWVERLQGAPRLLRVIGGLRRCFATLTVPFTKQVLVLRHCDVIEVLTRDQDFTIAEINAPRINRVGGAFILAMDRSTEYDREAAALRSVMKPETDLEQIRQIVQRTARLLIKAARPNGRLDVAGGYSRVVVARVLAEYFGVPGPSEHILMQWMRSLFWDIFRNPKDEALVRRAADFSAVELRDYLNQLIASRRKRAFSDDLLTRLVRAKSLDDDGVRRNIMGVIVGTMDNTVTATVNAIDELLSRPEVLRKATEAATAGDADGLLHYCYEALRFRPPLPGLLRYSRRGRTLKSCATIPADVEVVPLTISAMFDPKAFPRAKEFRVDRDIKQYLYFGYGMHACLGRLINGVLIPELIGTLLRELDFRRAAGRDGRVAYEGPFPDRLVIEF